MAATGQEMDFCLTDYTYLFQPELLKGKVAFITGGGSGIGFTIAEILMRHKCNVAIASRNLERVQSAARKLEAATGQKCLALRMDVRKPQEVNSVVEEILNCYKRIDILVNNAAGNFLSPAAGLSTNAFRTVVDIDAVGTFTVSRTVFEKYFKDHGGVIMNISATIAYRGRALQVHACAAKNAVDAQTKCLAVEWGANKVRVVGLAPGPIADTEGTRRLGGANRISDSAMKGRIPLGCMGSKVEMAHTVLFLVSDAASYITGETVVADGGSWLMSPNSMPAFKPQTQSKM